MPPFSRPTTTPPSARTGAANVGILGAILLAVLMLSVRCGNRAVKTLVRSADEGIQQMDGLHRTPTNGRAAGNDAAGRCGVRIAPGCEDAVAARKRRLPSVQTRSGDGRPVEG